MPLPSPQTLFLTDVIDNNVKHWQGDLPVFSCNPLHAAQSCGHQSERTRRFGQHLLNARIKLRLNTKCRCVIPEPPVLRPAMHVMDHNTTLSSGPIGRPIVKNPTISKLFATMTTPSPHKSSPLSSSQHQLPLRPGFPRSKPRPDFYHKALKSLERASMLPLQAGQENMWVKKKLKKHASLTTSTKRRVRA